MRTAEQNEALGLKADTAPEDIPPEGVSAAGEERSSADAEQSTRIVVRAAPGGAAVEGARAGPGKRGGLLFDSSATATEKEVRALPAPHSRQPQFTPTPLVRR